MIRKTATTRTTKMGEGGMLLRRRKGQCVGKGWGRTAAAEGDELEQGIELIWMKML